MNTELEKKFKVTSPDNIKQELASIGAQFVGETHDVDTYFKVPQEKPNTLYLRLRTRGDKNTLAFHEVVSDLETKEWETEAADGPIIQSIIIKLGFGVDVVVDKTRQKYRLDSSEILLDEIAGLGHFVEIESPSEQELDTIASKLTLGARIIGKGYPDLLQENKMDGYN